MLSVDAKNTILAVFVLTEPGLIPTIYCNRGEHANHYTNKAIQCIIKKKKITSIQSVHKDIYTILNIVSIHN